MLTFKHTRLAHTTATQHATDVDNRSSNLQLHKPIQNLVAYDERVYSVMLQAAMVIGW